MRVYLSYPHVSLGERAKCLWCERWLAFAAIPMARSGKRGVGVEWRSDAVAMSCGAQGYMENACRARGPRGPSQHIPWTVVFYTWTVCPLKKRMILYMTFLFSMVHAVHV